MAVMKETDERFQYLSKKIGLFVLIAILGIAGIIVFIGIQRDVFTNKTKLYFISENGQGLNEGQAVKLSGFKIGKIEKLSLDDVAKVKVEISINTKYMKWIKTDSTIKLVKEGYIGDAVLEVTPGSVQAKQIPEGGYLNFQGAKSINEIIEELKDDIKPVLLDIKQIIHYINDPKGDVKQILGNVNKLSGDIQHTRELIDTMLKNTDKNLENTMKKTDTLLGSIKDTVDTTNNILKNVETKLPNMLDKVDKSLTDVQKITDDIKHTTSGAPVLMDKVTDITDDAKDITGAVKKTWPISSKIKIPEEKTIKVDSYE
ncbi:MAG TPA: MlaD family protein [Syntrophorhabdaceae bacterium]|nr:MlaD family protein [Syntrophorhabdaceae bacterium]HON86110.1 MlaD family protein [Syntrophorhabdaceae bacterium]HOT42366.1 MlaD family protein [Syntrophorhabdaceae bacterium]HQE80661.1 MlaD family protein [Syntrophorhabdaceae bacterium]HQH42738.1 MlaD family protein [Syntrophorhabdaceae bacterium]